MIRNIIFDMGNVLIRFESSRFMDRAGITDPGDRRLIMNELFRSVEWAQMDEGRLTEDTAAPSILARFPERLRPTVKELLFSWAYPCEEIPGMAELAAGLKEKGYHLYLLSNASRAQHAYWPTIPVSGLIEGKLISCDVHRVKPCPEIYRLFTERFSLRPEECVFIDDAPANVAGAVACGWQGIVFHGDAEELKAKLLSIGVSA